MTNAFAKPMADREGLKPACAASDTDAGCRGDSLLVHDHVDVLGVKVSAIDMKLAVKLAEEWIASGEPGYVCVAAVHGVMEAKRDPELLRIFNRAVIAAPDGMPLTWVGRLQGFTHMDRVFGPDFMMEMCRLSAARGYRHFLYGGKPGVAQALAAAMQRKLPGLQVVGTYTPPFRSLTPDEERDLAEQVSRARPHILWVGLSTPKQERFMANYVDCLQVPLLVGVGAAFDFHTGRIRDCSTWIKRAGLQWLHRLIQDPKRLWSRYLVNNPAFMWHVAWQLVRFRHGAPGPTKQH